MSNCTARTGQLTSFAGVRSHRHGALRLWLAYCAERCGYRTALSTRCASRGSRSWRASSPTTSCETAQQALWLHFPKPEEYFADPTGHPRTPRDQFAGVEEFPYRSWDLNRLAFHPDLVDAAERYLGTAELHLYKVELWAKYAGASDYDQPLHRDYGSHSLVVPRLDGRYQQLTTFIFLSDVTEEDGPTRIVPYERGKDVPFTPLYIEFGALADDEVPAVGPAGSLLVYRTDILHRGSDLTGARALAVLAPGGLPGAGERRGAGRWRGPSSRPHRWAKLMPQCTVRERDLFGFPRPGDAYWNEQTLADVALAIPAWT